MSDSEGESRTTAVGRKRNAAGEYKDLASYNSSRRSSKASKESGEISSSEDGEQQEESLNGSTKGTVKDTDSSSEDDEIEEGSAGEDEASSSSASDSTSSSDSSDSSDSDSDANPLDDIMARHDADGLIRLQELSNEDRHQQIKYFFSDVPADQRMHELVYCLACSERGHMAATCPARTCSHCGLVDRHSTSACPQYRRCGHCRQRGHDARDCKNRGFHGLDLCDVCNRPGHIEEECPKLWATSTQPLPVLKQIPVRELRRGCYSCGSAAHWGDNCKYVRVDDLNAIRTWSAAHAAKFVKYDAIEISDDEDERRDARPAKRLMGRAVQAGRTTLNYDDDDDDVQIIEPPARSWQISLLDDERD